MIIVSAFESDLDTLSEDIMILDVNPLEIMQMVPKARKFLETFDPYTGVVQAGYDAGPEIFCSGDVGLAVPSLKTKGYVIPDRPDYYPGYPWHTEDTKVLIFPGEVKFFCWAKNTNSYFKTYNIEELLKDLADKQLQDRR